MSESSGAGADRAPSSGVTQRVVLAVFVVLVLRAMKGAHTAPAPAHADSRPPPARVAV